MITDRIVINDPEHGRAISRASGSGYGVFNEKIDVCIARVKDGKLAGGAIYDGFTRNAIQAHVAGFLPGWVNRDLLWCMFAYPFIQLGVRKIIGPVPANNERAINFNKSLGFTEETRVKDVYPDSDLILFSMYCEDCRWLKIRPSGSLLSSQTPPGGATP